jgi:hypothetical protein
MYFDNLTWFSLIIFAIACGGFIYACLMRSCVDHSSQHGNQQKDD